MEQPRGTSSRGSNQVAGGAKQPFRAERAVPAAQTTTAAAASAKPPTLEPSAPGNGAQPPKAGGARQAAVAGTGPGRRQNGWVQLVDERLKFTPDELEGQLSSLAEGGDSYLVVGVLGLAGSGKSTIVHELVRSSSASSSASASASASVSDGSADGRGQKRAAADPPVPSTLGVQARVTEDRVILLDTHALVSPRLLSQHLDQQQHGPLTPTAGALHGCVDQLGALELLELHSLRLIMWLSSVCHVLLVVDDWRAECTHWRHARARDGEVVQLGAGGLGGHRGVNQELARLISVAHLLRPRAGADLLPRGGGGPGGPGGVAAVPAGREEGGAKGGTGAGEPPPTDADLKYEFHPAVALVYNRVAPRGLTACSLNAMVAAAEQQLGDTFCRRPGERTGGTIQAAEDERLDTNKLPANTPLADAWDSTGVRVWALPERRHGDDAQFQALTAELRQRVYSLPRRPMVPRRLGERDWLVHGARAMNAVSHSPFLLQYAQMLTRQWPL